MKDKRERGTVSHPQLHTGQMRFCSKCQYLDEWKTSYICLLNLLEGKTSAVMETNYTIQMVLVVQQHYLGFLYSYSYRSFKCMLVLCCLSLLTYGQYTPSGLMSSQHTFLHGKHYPLDRRAPRGCATLALSSTGRQVLLCQVAGQALWWSQPQQQPAADSESLQTVSIVSWQTKSRGLTHDSHVTAW